LFKACANSKKERSTDHLVKEIEELGGSAISVIADVTDAKALEHVAKTASLYAGKIDVWINNADVLAAGEFRDGMDGVN
jgi:NADP-dependent 3-hydroxy acid dehydrogenase YdfG